MSPKEKAKDLIEKYQFVKIANYTSMFEVKQCALIAVDEILEVISFNKYDDKYWEEEEYWNEVKLEIEKL